MKEKTTYFLLFIFLIPFLVISQNLPKDTIYGNIKRIREKVIFLTEKENPQLLYYTDYGHSGFMGPKSTISRFFNTWYSSNLCYYLNYERQFDKKGRIIKDVWFGKKDDFMDSYRYLYDEKNRLISTIDSSAHSTDTENHYFKEYGETVDENIIYENLELNIFSHNYKKYKKGIVMVRKNFDENGKIDEYINHYNKSGKLEYTIYKNPNSWKKLEGNSWGYGVQDSIGVTYKSLINEYDESDRLIKTQIFDLYSDDKHEKPIQTSQSSYVYEGNNLITKINSSKGYGRLTYANYRYDSSSKLLESYCCEENISNSKIIKKYTYNGDKIIKLTYSEESFETKKMVKNKISFSYKYDKNNNWIEIIKTVDGKDLYKWKRDIEYYQ
ncbi:hypothetical protein DNC80_13070 [Flavobacterium sp. SOK18b]|uniref:hypothetical protein n=1 Tax=Flavobacterium sp. SOK18b TaxID=797900 RepID=UPI0015FDBA72|nr:hypothetical protein [Flavobacterium sp. SOK18b]MBB1194595.1 hypothetical protein [Flavobacterium sp. SOK18b]